MGPGPGWVVAVAYGLPRLSAGVMWLEIVLASVLGLVIYWFVSRDKEETLPLEDGWWGPGARPPGGEDESIRHFKVETSDEEIDVRPLLRGRAERRGGGRRGLGLRLGLQREQAAPWEGASVCSSPTGVQSKSPTLPTRTLLLPTSVSSFPSPTPKAQQCMQLCRLLCAPPETWGVSL